MVTLLPQMTQQLSLPGRTMQPIPSTSGLNNSVCSSESDNVENEMTYNQNYFQNQDLKLRLDSFESKFDDFVKRIGGIYSEMCILRGEINEVNATLTEHSDQLSKHNGVSRTFSTMQDDYPLDDTKRKKRIKLESDYNPAQPPPQEASLEEEKQAIKLETENSEVHLPFIVDEEIFVHVYTHGASVHHRNRNTRNERARFGLGVWFGDGHPMNLSQLVDGDQTYKIAEIQAARLAVESAASAGVTKLKIHTTAYFLIDWINNWKKNGWRPPWGFDVPVGIEFEKLTNAKSQIPDIVWEKVYAGMYGKEMAKKLASRSLNVSRTPAIVSPEPVVEGSQQEAKNPTQPSSQGTSSVEERETIEEKTEDLELPPRFTVDEENFVHVYTRGVCLEEKDIVKAKAWIGVWFGDRHPMNLSQLVDGEQTRIAAEIQAARLAVESAASAGVTKLKVNSESRNFINFVTVCIHKWKKNGWRTSHGKVLPGGIEFEKLDVAISRLSDIVWKKTEPGTYGEEMAKELAYRPFKAYKETC